MGVTQNIIEIKREIYNLTKRVNEVINTYNILSNISGDTTELIATINTEITSINTQLSSLQTRVENIGNNNVNMASDITSLTSQLSTLSGNVNNISDALNDKADTSNTYSKNEVDTLLDGKQPTGDYVTIDNLVNRLKTKADSEDTYTKLEVDAIALGTDTKLGSYYTKAECNDLLGNKQNKIGKYEFSTTNFYSNEYKFIAYGNNTWVTTSDRNVLYSNDNGEHWNEANISLTEDISDIIFGNNKFVIICKTLTYYSEDGINWTQGDNMPRYQDWKVAYGLDMFIAIPINTTGGIGAVSYDGVNWDDAGRETIEGISPMCILPYPLRQLEWNIVFGDNKFFIFVTASNIYYYSLDGFVWIKVDNFDNVHSITYGNGLWIAICDEGKIFYSKDLINWVEGYTFELNDEHNCVIVFNGTDFIVSTGGYYYRSSDGMHWEYLKKTEGVTINACANIDNSYVSFVNVHSYLEGSDGWYNLISDYLNEIMKFKPLVIRDIYKPYYRYETDWFTVAASGLYSFDLTDNRILELDKTKITCTVIGKAKAATNGFKIDDIVYPQYDNYNGSTGSNDRGMTTWISGTTLGMRCGNSCVFGENAPKGSAKSISAANVYCKIILEGWDL